MERSNEQGWRSNLIEAFRENAIEKREQVKEVREAYQRERMSREGLEDELAGVRQEVQRLLVERENIRNENQMRQGERDAELHGLQLQVQRLQVPIQGIQSSDTRMKVRFRFAQVLPVANSVGQFLATIPNLQPGQELDVPVWALRWTHATVNAQMAFGEDHDHAQ